MLRQLVGPMPKLICQISTYFGLLAVTNACHFTMLIAVAKFAFVFIYKRLPMMDDKLLSTVAMIVTYIWGLLAVSAKVYVDEQIPSSVVSLQKPIKSINF